MARPEGARVTGITRNSPAEQARILVGDVILEFDGTRVEDDMHLINLVSLTPVQKEVEVRLLREGRTLGLRARVARPDSLFVQLNAVLRRAAEHHSSKTAVADWQRLHPFARWTRIPQGERWIGFWSASSTLQLKRHKQFRRT